MYLHPGSPAGHAGTGTTVTARIDWERRHRMMRLHTTSHLLCHVVPQLVNGCSITPDYARLDFAMTDPLDKEQLTAAIATMVAAAHPLTVASISDEAGCQPQPGQKSMSVQPPQAQGRIRTIRIGGEGDAPLIDLQPCGGTHVANTAEIGGIVVTKIERKRHHPQGGVGTFPMSAVRTALSLGCCRWRNLETPPAATTRGGTGFAQIAHHVILRQWGTRRITCWCWLAR